MTKNVQRSMPSYMWSRVRALTGAAATDTIQPEAWILDGMETSSREQLRVLYIGDQNEKNYIKHLLFGELCTQTHIGRRHLWSWKQLVQQGRFDCPLAIIQGNQIHRRIFSRNGDFWLPLWLHGEVDVPLVAHNKSAREELKRVRKSRLEYVVTSDLDQFRLFYHEMNRPYVTKRYEDTVVSGPSYTSFEDVMQMAKYGAFELLLVKKDHQPIAGVLVLFSKRLPRFWAMAWRSGVPLLCMNGLKDGDFSYLKDGAIAATYYFASVYLSDQGYKTMGVGMARPFLSDGLLKYKRKWGMRAVGYTPGGFLVKPLSLTPAVIGFLKTNPFVCIDRGRLCGAAFFDPAELNCNVRSGQMARGCHLAGLSAWYIYECSTASIRRYGTLAGDSIDAWAGGFAPPVLDTPR